MKALTSITFATAAFAAGIKEHADTAVAATNTTTGATCGLGYTYCGYILKEQKSESFAFSLSFCGAFTLPLLLVLLSISKRSSTHQPSVDFDDATILTAYCAGGYCDSTNGTTDTDPMQGLYVCLPESAVPRQQQQRRDDEPYTGPVKIELLCACSGTPFGGGENVCLNPEGDHIGRCSTPCSNSDELSLRTYGTVG